ncbi:glycine betaine ABC transporter substrate-binding protein [Neobacillus cucumis]|nr:glycine betaine ABC transporter substrate-binding protein [Neobacillus cucumis]
MREDTLKKYPKLKGIINELGEKITEKDMAEMTQVDLDKQDPRDVAREFLKKKGFIK